MCSIVYVRQAQFFFWQNLVVSLMLEEENL